MKQILYVLLIVNFSYLSANCQNVGINNTIPKATLDVNGALLIGSSQSSHLSQGAYLEWNKDLGGGKSYLLNQKGLGLGGIVFGEINSGNYITERARIETNGNLVLNNGLALTRGKDINISHDNYLIDVSNIGYIRLTGTDITLDQFAQPHTVILSDGLNTGQILIVQCFTVNKLSFFLNQYYGGVLFKDDSFAFNTNLSKDFYLGFQDTLTLLWDGFDWVELNRVRNQD